MGSVISVKAEGVGKRYRIGGALEKHTTLRDAVAAAVKRPIERLRHPGSATHVSEEIWALRDVSLEVEEGEVLGLIGSNGAGKSTFLKIISRITEPTEGEIHLNGRVGSLLEVGTGFHAELTGRENIYLNGAILGMTRAEINRRFDEIVEFSEISRFLDTPVKRYSSGMYVRLAFAVAAHLEPEILVIDEVLAVGDAAFQAKCLGRMEDVANAGRTVLFVSHNMQAIRSLCTRVVELQQGTVVDSGPPSEVVDRYLRLQGGASGVLELEGDDRLGDGEVLLAAVRILGPDRVPTSVVVSSQPFSVQMDVDLESIPYGLTIGFDLALSDTTVAFRSYQTDADPSEWPELRRGRNRLECRIPPNLLNAGRYTVLPRISIDRQRWIVRGGAVSFDVQRDAGASIHALAAKPGAVAPVLTWARDGSG
ncbi:MAG: ATP-binding cassette domain-containing protein [Actinobacteria bacterium]|nr:ATP-binding cassette domain-containing protein [Actinomycetota bacterium]